MYMTPIAINVTTTNSFTTTITLLTHADWRMPTMSMTETTQMMNTAGRFAMPCSEFPAASTSSGPCTHAAGRSILKMSWKNETTYPDQLMDTADEATAYSRTRSQPMIHARYS